MKRNNVQILYCIFLLIVVYYKLFPNEKYISPFEGKFYVNNINQVVIDKLFKPLELCFQDSILKFIKSFPIDCVQDNQKSSLFYDCSGTSSDITNELFVKNGECVDFIENYILTDSLRNIIYYECFDEDLIFFNTGLFSRQLTKNFYYYLNNISFDIRPLLDSLFFRKLFNESLISQNLLKDTINGVYIPKDFNDALGNMHIFWNNASLQRFKDSTEDFAVNFAHLNEGLCMRQTWKLWGRSRLWKFFSDLGVSNGDIISGMLLQLYHRLLNNKPLHFNELLQDSKNYQLKSDFQNDNYDEKMIKKFQKALHKIEQKRKNKLK